MKRLALTLLILTFLYSNLFVLLYQFPAVYPHLPLIRINAHRHFVSLQIGSHTDSALHLPLPTVLLAIFNGAAIFNAYGHFNYDFKIIGHDMRTNEWVELPVLSRYFPYHSLGVTYMRLTLPWHTVIGGDVTEHAYRNLTRKIRQRFNKDYPQRTVDRVALYMTYWPRSEAGYETLRTQSSETFILLFAE